MSSGRHPPRRPPVEDYWRAYEASVAPPPGSAARNLERLRARVRAGEVVDEPRDEDRPRSAEGRPRAAAAGLVLLGKSASVSVGLATAALLSIKLIAGGWVQLRGAEAPPPPAIEASPRPAAPRARAAAHDPRPGPAPEPARAPEASGASPLPAAGARAPRRAEPEAPEDRLRAEVMLMDRARAALGREDFAALAALLDEHARRFEGGALTEEREAWRAVVACRLGHPSAADGAQRFLLAHPRSAQASKVRAACEGPQQP